MAFGNSNAKPAPRRAKKDLIFPVGGGAFVHWPARPERSESGVPLTNIAGVPLDNNLIDGQQVEIVSWRPHSRDGIRYQVRRMSDGIEGWIEARCLRRDAVFITVEVPVLTDAAR